MGGIGLEILLIALCISFEHPGFFESVEFVPDSIGGIAEFGFQAPQIGPGTAVEEELKEQLDPRFRRNEGFDHGFINIE
jgi:hypothetical protein